VTPAVFAAAAVVVETARAGLDVCGMEVRDDDGDIGLCGEYTTHTVNSPDHSVCPMHAEWARKVGNNSVWDAFQAPLVKAIRLFDQAVADAARESLGGK
jgi:hypothetical protein